MLTYLKDEFREFFNEAKTPLGILRGIGLIVLFVSLGAMFIQHYDTATTRYVYLIYVACVMFLIWLLTGEYKDKLDAAAIAKTKLKDRMKLSAELCGAVAVLSFLVSFYRLGLDIDRGNTDGRIAHLVLAANHISSERCISDAENTIRCDRLKRDIDVVKDAIRAKNESAISSGINQLKMDAIHVVSGRTSQHRFEQEVDAAAIGDDGKYLTLSVLMLTMVFSALTISRKIAIAWFDNKPAAN